MREMVRRIREEAKDVDSAIDVVWLDARPAYMGAAERDISLTAKISARTNSN
jgi:hypothetical protein